MSAAREEYEKKKAKTNFFASLTNPSAVNYNRYAEQTQNSIIVSNSGEQAQKPEKKVSRLGSWFKNI